MAHKNLMGGTAYETKSGRCLVDGTGYSIVKGRTLVDGTGYDIGFGPIPEGSTLNACSWANISELAASGVAENYWSIGDCKEITVNGTVGTLTISGTYCVYIIGFNHNGSSNTIDFGTFKTALSDGVDACLTDSKYDNNYSADGTKYFNINHWIDSAPGAWKACDLRYDILGSTDVAPSNYGTTATSKTGYDATSTCATNPVPNTLMAAFPADLRAVMKPMTVYTSNRGVTGSSYVVSSVDYLPLLAEFEVTGARSLANYYERTKQAQYSYFKNGNSTIKHKHNAVTTKALYWIRSVSSSNSSGKLWIFMDSEEGSGGVGHALPYNSFGLAPIFRV